MKCTAVNRERKRRRTTATRGKNPPRQVCVGFTYRSRAFLTLYRRWVLDKPNKGKGPAVKSKGGAKEPAKAPPAAPPVKESAKAPPAGPGSKGRLLLVLKVPGLNSPRLITAAALRIDPVVPAKKPKLPEVVKNKATSVPEGSVEREERELEEESEGGSAEETHKQTQDEEGAKK